MIIADDEVRCPGCRGMMKVAKLGGVVGDCNTCKGEGKVKIVDKPVMVKEPIVNVDSQVIKGVADCLPEFVNEPEVLPQGDVVEAVNKEGKRAIYKRKKA